jgi:tetratricopeptide (TPR) repeat protein
MPVKKLLITLFGIALASYPVSSAESNEVSKAVSADTKASSKEDEADKELKKLEADDDAALEEVDGWIQQNQQFATQGAGIPTGELNDRIRKRLESVEKAYEDFIKRHPNHAKARIAYASFLNDIGEEDREFEHLEKARELDPADPAVWNNLANYYGHNSPVKKAFEYYEKAISLDPTEPIYYHNFGTTVYLFRKDATEYYSITEQQVFDKALELYSKALKLDPTNFPLASDVAMTYYGIRPVRTNDALRAWTNALSIATDEVEREGVYLHFARIKLNAGRFKEAQEHLNSVTNAFYASLKTRLTRNLMEKESGTNTISEAEPELVNPAKLDSPSQESESSRKKSPPR